MVDTYYKRPSQKHLANISEVLEANNKQLTRLPADSQDTYLRLCSLVSHMRFRAARNFYIKTFDLIESYSVGDQRRQVLQGALQMGSLHWSLVLPFLQGAKSILLLGGDFDEWLRLGLALGHCDQDVAVCFLEGSPTAAQRYGYQGLLDWGQTALAACRRGNVNWRMARAYLQETIAADNGCGFERWSLILELADQISDSSPMAAEAFVRQGAHSCSLLSIQELRRWVAEGLAKHSNEQDLAAFFNADSAWSHQQRDQLVSGENLKDHAGALSLICEAYLGRPVRVRARKTSETQAMSGNLVCLPPVAASFAHFKLMALHQCALAKEQLLMLLAGEGPAGQERAHLAADRTLLAAMPGLRNPMNRIAAAPLPTGYPEQVPPVETLPLPWWGDMPPLDESKAVAEIARIRQEAAEACDLDPDELQALLKSLMALDSDSHGRQVSQLNQVLEDWQFASPEAEELDEEYETYNYWEWDRELGDYKIDWCLVRERQAGNAPNPLVDQIGDAKRGIIALIRNQFARLRPERFRKFRAQNRGDDLDINALVEAVIDLKAVGELSENVYIRRDKRVRDVAVMFLVDQSISTEEKVEGRRVMDIQKEAIVMMAEALESLGDPFAIMGFSSEGRFRIDMFMVKDFDDQYSEQAHNRLGNLEPLNFTRLGAVIRHATHKLDQVPAAVRLLVVLTDGRPYDCEYGNLDYAVADTKKALQETRQKRISPFIITTDQKGAAYLKQISPQTQSIIVPRAELLPLVLPKIYKRLTT